MLNTTITNFITSSEVNEKAYMLTAYESFGSVGMSDYLEMLIDDLLIDVDTIDAYNEYCRENGYVEYVTFSDLVDLINSCYTPAEVMRMTYYGEINMADDYFCIDGCGNISSIGERRLLKEIGEDKEFCKWYIENYEDFDEAEAETVIALCNKLVKLGY